jgi:hypothetical protein
MLEYRTYSGPDGSGALWLGLCFRSHKVTRELATTFWDGCARGIARLRRAKGGLPISSSPFLRAASEGNRRLACGRGLQPRLPWTLPRHAPLRSSCGLHGLGSPRGRPRAHRVGCGLPMRARGLA